MKAFIADLLRTLRRTPGKDRPLRLPDMLARRGVFLPAELQGAAAQEARLAAQRCSECRSKELCDEWLAAGQPGAYRGFCPNTHYIEQLRTRRRARNKV